MILNIRIVGVGLVLLAYLRVPAQNLFVTDYDGFKGVYEITPTGSQNNFASGLPAPSALAFDNAGNLFVSDVSGDCIFKITPSGVTNTFATGLNTPYGLAFDKTGNLFEADYGTSTIYEFTNHNGTLASNLNVFASIGLNGPVGLAFDRSNDLFESDFNSGTIYEFTNRDGTLVSNLNVFVSGMPNPAGMAFNSSNVLFVANDSIAGSIIEIMPNASTNAFASGLAQPIGLAFDNAGNLFVANQNANNIIKITPGGTQSIYFSEPSTNFPSGVAFVPVAQLQALRTTNKTIHVTVSCPSPYYSTVVLASTNFINWAALYTNTPPFTFTDSMTVWPRRYYRALNSTN